MHRETTVMPIADQTACSTISYKQTLNDKVKKTSTSTCRQLAVDMGVWPEVGDITATSASGISKRHYRYTTMTMMTMKLQLTTSKSAKFASKTNKFTSGTLSLIHI